jgi:hypothetical protein
MMQRQMQRAALAFDGTLKMFAGRLTIMFVGNCLRVTEPIGGDFGWEEVSQFGCSTAS